VEGFVLPEDLAGNAPDLFTTDYKSALQEYLQGEREGPADYRVVEESGPEHQKTFTVEVSAGNDRVARGRGGSKKAAEQRAARSLLQRLGRKTEAHDGGT
jgi:ribonuclease-3